jgi:hypothetical protein
MTVVSFTAEDVARETGKLAELLMDAVASGASRSPMCVLAVSIWPGDSFTVTVSLCVPTVRWTSTRSAASETTLTSVCRKGRKPVWSTFTS